MSSIPSSRYLFYPITWYSFLIVTGVLIAVILACREEKRAGLPKDTVIDLTLLLLPCGIIGARLYYVVFSWPQFSGDFLSVFRIWEGGLAIYGGVIGGFLAVLFFSRRRRLPLLLLCDMIVPGLVLAQALGRWGNWFNIEAYGRTVTDPALCFFPFSLQVPDDGYAWHLATFFYESFWNFCVFLFLCFFRRKYARRIGDVFCCYLLLYASGRLVIEELRLDSLYASSSVRVSQLLSVLICLGVLLRYVFLFRGSGSLPRRLRLCILPPAGAAVVFALLYTLCGSIFAAWPVTGVILSLSLCALVFIGALFFLHHALPAPEVSHADNET